MKLAEVQKLAESPLIFQLTAPPSPEAIALRKAALPLDLLIRVEKRNMGYETLVVLLLLLTVLEVFFCIMLFAKAPPDLDWLPWSILPGLAVTLFGAIKADAYVTGYSTCLAKLLAESAGLEPMPAHRCDEMLALCQATPEGVAYRQQVLRQGREFVEAEYALLDNWSQGVLERKACRALYGDLSR